MLLTVDDTSISLSLMQSQGYGESSGTHTFGTEQKSKLTGLQSKFEQVLNRTLRMSNRSDLQKKCLKFTSDRPNIKGLAIEKCLSYFKKSWRLETLGGSIYPLNNYDPVLTELYIIREPPKCS